jgi:hypothetical protein
VETGFPSGQKEMCMPKHQAQTETRVSPRNRDQALASAVPMPTMAMPVESMQAAAKTAIGRGATFHEPSIRAARSIGNASRTAVYPRHKTHRYRANGRGAHHGQDDTARTFHGITCSCTCEEFWESQALIFKP